MWFIFTFEKGMKYRLLNFFFNLQLVDVFLIRVLDMFESAMRDFAGTSPSVEVPVSWPSEHIHFIFNGQIKN